MSNPHRPGLSVRRFSSRHRLEIHSNTFPRDATEFPLLASLPVAESSEVVRQNRTYWEQLAPHRPGEPIDFFREGGTALTEPELAIIGNVHGRRVLHLACSVGDEALSFAQLGALVTAVDLAPSHLATARAKAEALNLPVEFIEQDMMTLDPAITGFDIIYISWGGLCWVPDITKWTQLVTERLNPGEYW